MNKPLKINLNLPASIENGTALAAITMENILLINYVLGQWHQHKVSTISCPLDCSSKV